MAARSGARARDVTKHTGGEDGRMESGGKPFKRASHSERAQGHAPSAEMVRETSIFAGLYGRVGQVVDYIANRYSGGLVARSTLSTWQQMNPWRRLTCHIAPIMSALAVSYVVIALFGDRYHPRQVLDMHIEPPGIVQGAVGAIVYTAIDDRTCAGVVHRSIVDATGVQHGLADMPAFYNATTTRGAQFRFSREFAVPYVASPGIATYHSETVRWCNVFQEYIWPMIDVYKITFTILERTPGSPLPMRAQ